MKKIFTTFLIVFSFVLSSKAQWVTIPDANFATWLNNNISTSGCMNGNQLDTTCSTLLNVITVNIDQFQYHISDLTGIQYFDSLEYLICTPQIFVMPDSLSYIPSLPNLLKHISLSYNKLIQLPALPDSLLDLYCDHNQLTSLPNLPNALTELFCDNNLLINLPSLPISLHTLSCENNQLTSLPTLIDSLAWLFCKYNFLTGIPAIPNTLEQLQCDHNQLTSLPSLINSKLFCFTCSFNQLTSLPTLPSTVYSFDCNDNQISYLTSMSDTFYSFWIHNNPIYCLPYISYFGGAGNQFDISGTNITCLPNVIEHFISIPQIDTLPICGLFNANGCPVYWNIMGSTYFDENNNCIYDSIDLIQPNIQVQLWSGGNLSQITFTDPLGNYSFDVNTFGTYEVKIDTSLIPFSVLCPNGGIHTCITTAIDSMDSNVDFALVCKPNYDVSTNSVVRDSGLIRPGNKSLIGIHAGDFANFYGAACMNGIGGQLQVTVTGSAQYNGYVAGSLAPTTVTGNTITWTIVDFGTVDFFHDFHIRLITDTNAVIGSQVCIDATVSANPADVNQSNNHLNQCFTVVSSFDPNVKEVSLQELTSTNDYLTYTIHFQNTGTAPAQHIQILDTLDSDLDVSTFQLLAYSHANMTQVLEGGIVKFNFPNINLPDSGSNEPASHGYIQYKIKPKAGTPLTSSFDNTASIYFDFNSPVVTNTTHTSFASGISELPIENELLVYPNPVENQLTVYSKQLAFTSIEIIDVIGRKVFAETMNQRSAICNLKSLSSGIYFIKVQLQNGELHVKKIVKQ